MNRPVVLLALSLAALSGAAEFVRVVSPDGRNEIRLETEPSLGYSVWRDGRVRVAPTPLRLDIEEKGVLGAKSEKVVARERRSRAGRVASRVYKKAFVDDDGNETLVRFESGWGVALHARNDGVAWRFETSFGGEATVRREESGAAFPKDASFLFAQARDGFQSSWESVYSRAKSLADIPVGREHFVYLPLTVTYPDGVAMCLTESSVWDYPCLGLVREDGDTDRLHAHLAPEPLETKRIELHMIVMKRRERLVRTTGTRAYPWRVFLLAESAPKLVESDVVWALAEPCRIDDASWVKPGLAVWNWWHGNTVTDLGFEAGFDTRTFKAYVDFAAKCRVPYVLVDAGWTGGADGLDLDVINPAFDLDGLVAYAAARKVDLILWAAWPDLADPERRRRLFRHYAARGVKGFKIDFFDRDDAEVAAIVAGIARDAAESRLVLDLHGFHKPEGLSRTYPNILNYEGIHGMECEKWETKEVDFPANDVKAVYSRLLAGPMDYTPGGFLNVRREDFRPVGNRPMVQGTRVHQLALYTVYEAPLQMLSESPSVYRASDENRACTDFIVRVPTVWDDTVALCGELADSVAVARRAGDVWYVGAIGDWSAHELEIDTSFLGKGEWTVEVFSDADDADREPTHYIRAVRKVASGERLKVRLAPGGGWTARFSR